MQPAEFGIDIAQPGSQSGDVAVLQKRALGALDRFGKCGFERQEPAVAPAAIGRQLKQRLLGGFDLARSVKLGIGTERHC